MDQIPGWLLQPGCACSLAWGSVVRQLAAGLGISLDGVEEMASGSRAPEASTLHNIWAAPPPLRFSEVLGLACASGSPEHVTRLRADLCPEWPQLAQPGGSYHRNLRRALPRHGHSPEQPPRGTTTNAGLVASDAHRDPLQWQAAETGYPTTLDLPLITGEGRQCCCLIGHFLAPAPLPSGNPHDDRQVGMTYDHNLLTRTPRPHPDSTGLRAPFINATLKRSPELAIPTGLLSAARGSRAWRPGRHSARS